MEYIHLQFPRYCQLSPKQLYKFTVQAVVDEVLTALHFFLYFLGSIWEVDQATHHGLNMNFLDCQWGWAYFHVFIGDLYFLFCGVPNLVFTNYSIGLSFFRLLMQRALKYFSIMILCQLCFTNTFPHAVACLFTFFMMSSDKRKS